jgi:hypothetical protein
MPPDPSEMTVDERVSKKSPEPAAIELRIGEISQLFDTLDPFPFPERDLDKDAEEFIVGWARELPRDHPLEIVLHMPSAVATKLDAGDIAAAIRRYFDYRAGIITRDINEMFRVGRVSLAIGLTVLAAGLVASQALAPGANPSAFKGFIQQSIVIVSWVANWRPIQIFLYDWWPLVRRRNLYRRLAAAEVELRPY